MDKISIDSAAKLIIKNYRDAKVVYIDDIGVTLLSGVDVHLWNYDPIKPTIELPYSPLKTGGLGRMSDNDISPPVDPNHPCSSNRIFTHKVYECSKDNFKDWVMKMRVAFTEKSPDMSVADLSPAGFSGVASNQTTPFIFSDTFDPNEKFFTFWGEQLFTTRMVRNPTSYLESGVMVEDKGEQAPLFMVYGKGKTSYYDKQLNNPILVDSEPLKTTLFSSFLSDKIENNEIQFTSEIPSGINSEMITEIGLANDEILIGRVTPIKPLDTSSGSKISFIISGKSV